MSLDQGMMVWQIVTAGLFAGLVWLLVRWFRRINPPR